MKFADRILQTWRLKKAVAHLAVDDKIIDIGTHDGALFRFVGGPGSVGIDPNLVSPIANTQAKFVRGFFPQDLEAENDFDAVVALAMIEHIDHHTQVQLAKDCYQYLREGGKVIVTTPSPFVDKILDVLFFLKVIDGMGGTHEDHYGFEPMDAVPIFESAGFVTEVVSRFQFGLNYLMVFRKTHDPD